MATGAACGSARTFAGAAGGIRRLLLRQDMVLKA